MKQIALIALISISILIGCKSNNDSKQKSPVKDSTYFKKVMAEIQMTKKILKEVTSKDSAIIKDKERLMNLIDTLQSQLQSAHLDQMKLIEVEHKFKIASIVNNQLIARVNILNRKIEDLNDSNLFINDKLKSTSSNLIKAKNENNDLKKAIKFKIANVKIKAYGYTHGFLKKTKLIETELAKETKFIEISFIVVANDKIEKTTYNLNIEIRTSGKEGIAKSYPIYFNGEEIGNSTIKFEDPNELESGYHHVDITLNNESLYSGSILLK